MAPAKKPLAEYDAKRDFAATPEPHGAAAPSGELRFVIQEHHATRLHWDLRLERDGVLASFAVPNALPVEAKKNHLAVRTEDHPLEYLDFHGTIPKGNYGAGEMTIWDRGTYEVLKWDEGEKIEVHLHGERIDAQYALFPIDKASPPKDWMIHVMGVPGEAPIPDWVPPMLAKAAPLPPDDDLDWAYEIKWDGIRAIAVSTPGALKLYTRNRNEVGSRYPELKPFNRALSHHRAILDGEIIAFGPDGTPSFSALQSRMHLTSETQAKRLAKSSPVSYVVFDLLWLDGQDLTRLPYTQRRELLADLFEDSPRWSVPAHVVGHGSQVLEAAKAQGLEGVMAKRLDCPYDAGQRANGWRKVKLTQRQELVVCGWVPGTGRRRDRIGALVLAVQEDGELHYAGRVGTGFTQDELDRLAGLLGPLERPDSPLTAHRGLARPPKETIWVEPHYLAEVEFTEWSPDQQVRHPSYKGLRDDKPVYDVVNEGAKAAEVLVDDVSVRLSNPRKVLYPQAEFTKTDVLDYYLRIADVLLPHLAGRALTLKRYPNGVEGKFFYEKNAPSHRPDWVRTARVDKIDYVLCEDRPTLAWLANLADLELHTPMARADAPSRPTMVVFDLDPGAPATIVECCRVALLLEGMLGGLGLQTWAKTSGSKGLQLYVPLNDPGATEAAAKGFSKMVAELLEAEVPELVVSKQAKVLRGGKVLVDWSQNDEHKTTVNVYSLRAREKPTVSTPVGWAEVRACAASGDPEHLTFTAGEVLARVRADGDLFAPVLTTVQRLPG